MNDNWILPDSEVLYFDSRQPISYPDSGYAFHVPTLSVYHECNGVDIGSVPNGPRSNQFRYLLKHGHCRDCNKPIPRALYIALVTLHPKQVTFALLNKERKSK